MQMDVNYLKDNSDFELFGKPEKYEYSKYANIEGFSLDENLMKEFLDIAQKLNLSQRSLEILLDMAFNMSKKQNEIYENKIDNDIITWSNEFDNDTELPDKNSNNLKEFMSVADDAYNEFATPKLKELFKKTGLIFHPELIKMFHRIGEMMQEDIAVYGPKPPAEELTPAQILYGNRD